VVDATGHFEHFVIHSFRLVQHVFTGFEEAFVSVAATELEVVLLV